MFNNDGTWYRAEVCELPEPDVVTVRYVDYGNSSQVPLGAIRHPKAHYLILPAQGIQCRLANLKPAGSVSRNEMSLLLVQSTPSLGHISFKCTIHVGIEQEQNINLLRFERPLKYTVPLCHIKATQRIHNLTVGLYLYK